MDPDHVDGGAVEDAVGEVLNAIDGLQTRDAATDDGDVGAVEPDFELQVCGDVTEPRFAGWDGPDVAEGLVLDVDALACVSSRI